MTDMHLTTGELVDYLRGELPVARDAASATHLAQCADCRAAADREAALTEMIRAVATTQERPMPSGVTASIRASVAQGSSGASNRHWSARPMFAVPAALAAAVLIWLGVRAFTENQTKPTIAAGYLVNRHAMLSAITPFADDAPIPPAFVSDDASH